MIQRNLANLIIAAVLYLNLAALLLSCGVRFSSPWDGVRGIMPNHWIGQRIFRMFGLFSGFTEYNQEYLALGVRERLQAAPPQPLPDMIDLDIYAHFPGPRGQANRHLSLLGYVGSSNRLEQAYIRMATALQRRHNHKAGSLPVAQVFIYKHWWPKSRRGFYDLADRRQTALVGFN